MTDERQCPRCGNPVPLGHERYCSSRCKKAMYRRRRRATVSHHTRAWWARKSNSPWWRFRESTQHDTNLAVAETDAHQQQARQLIAAGFAAYVNRAGLVRDVALPRDARNAGRIFAVIEREGQS